MGRWGECGCDWVIGGPREEVLLWCGSVVDGEGVLWCIGEGVMRCGWEIGVEGVIWSGWVIGGEGGLWCDWKIGEGVLLDTLGGRWCCEIGGEGKLVRGAWCAGAVILRDVR